MVGAYIKYRETSDEEDETKYQIRGQDFAIDLCCALDIFYPIISLMNKVQTVNIPVWKIVGWFSKVVEEITAMIDKLQKVNEGSSPSARLFPRLSGNWKEISQYDEND